MSRALRCASAPPGAARAVLTPRLDVEERRNGPQPKRGGWGVEGGGVPELQKHVWTGGRSERV